MPNPTQTRDKLANLRHVVREVLAPLVMADGGRLYVVNVDEARVSLHLAGELAGCPGNAVLARRVVEPALRAVSPQLEVEVSWGLLIPKGAVPAVPSGAKPA